MPAIDQHLHYRMIDVTSLREVAKRVHPAIAEEWVKLRTEREAAATKHRARDDAYMSLYELRHYVEHWLTPSLTPRD